jgi:transposase
MRLELDNLPSEPALLWHLVRDMAAVVEHCDGEIERLKSIIKQLQHSQFGRRSEWLDPDQLALASSPATIFLPMKYAKRKCPAASTSALSRRA